MSYSVPSTPTTNEKIVFNNRRNLSSNVLNKTKEFILAISRLNIDPFFIGGSFATACYYSFFNEEDCLKRFMNLFNDIDIFVSTAQFKVLAESGNFKLSSEGMLETEIVHNKKVQIIDMNGRTIESIVSDFDLSFNWCFLTISLYEKPIITWSMHSNWENVTINPNGVFKENLIFRAAKYAKRYPNKIKQFIIQADQIDKIIPQLEEMKVQNQSEDDEPKRLVSTLKRFNKIEFDK